MDNPLTLKLSLDIVPLLELLRTGLKSATKGSSRRIAIIRSDFIDAFEKYLLDSYDKYSKVKTLFQDRRPVYLYDFFVQPTLETPENKDIDLSTNEELLSISRYLIISGNGGIGKSTLMRHILLMH